ncbi:hypothetical protein EJ06DRAFT_479549 [Trichodelitschia bisporula]|uniref:F-box domain-containing protein n=1 Tax=Trichodelitschia bisporula TaxID=703511 RepID=A0A6G1HSB5_9PEZI|nr:hypothetical protein EJ06DRAFT_479549 [Trichodelitschia bisporula]
MPEPPHAVVHRVSDADLSSSDECDDEVLADAAGPRLSPFEQVVTTCPPILESLLAFLPTQSILQLYHTSRHLRRFMGEYPLAWKSLSFRLPQPAVTLGSPHSDDSRERQSKQYALDALLIRVVMPMASRLKSLDLCNTAVSGVALVSRVLQPRVSTLEHLSVRGCKNVSIKYHIVPFLQLQNPANAHWLGKSDLALKSLYTYRCRHHRRRPYLPSSLVRRDSDSEPTHELIEICHQLGIWTDTAWCPTPGARCFRRKDYHSNRAAAGTTEVWVPFDRLWRSGNRIGGPNSENGSSGSSSTRPSGRLWEDADVGHEGEPLGAEDGPVGEGKYVPAHLRKSHRTFVEDVRCDGCNETILERCETCSIKMHCMGCRKTLCASCAFNRPIPSKRAKTRHSSGGAHGYAHRQGDRAGKFWWAAGATRSPNLMSEPQPGEDTDDSEEGGEAAQSAQPPPPPKLNMHWCCLEPIFSGGGGVAFLGPNISGEGSDRIRAVPLPRQRQYEDADFMNLLLAPNMKNTMLYEEIIGGNIDILPYLQQDSLDLQAQTCPRSLCQDCYRSFRWKVNCRKCKKPLCKEHDFRALKLRRCGFRELFTEREYVRSAPARLAAAASVHPRALELANLQIPDFRPPSAAPGDEDDSASTASLSDSAPLLATSLALPRAAPAPPSFSIPELPRRGLVAGTGARARSLSCSGLKRDEAARAGGFLEEQRRKMLLPGYGAHPVQWVGCGSYFCQATRPVGDVRARCAAEMRECGGCRVLVCEGCVKLNPSCPCQVCVGSFHCPACAKKPEIRARCVREEDLRMQEAKREGEKFARKKEADARVVADEVALSVQEFFEGAVWGAAGMVSAVIAAEEAAEDATEEAEWEDVDEGEEGGVAEGEGVVGEEMVG